MRKFVGDPAPAGKGQGLKTIGETKSTKTALAHASLAGKSGKYGKKK